jgi:septal ring factor EnvC (AmiA/AmiB activator)
MARMIAEVYHAFKAAGVDDQTAQAAATALTQPDDEIQEIRKDFQAVRDDFQALRDEFKDMKGDMKVLSWKVNLVLGLLAVLVVQAILLPLFR